MVHRVCIVVVVCCCHFAFVVGCFVSLFVLLGFSGGGVVWGVVLILFCVCVCFCVFVCVFVIVFLWGRGYICRVVLFFFS